MRRSGVASEICQTTFEYRIYVLQQFEVFPLKIPDPDSEVSASDNVQELNVSLMLMKLVKYKTRYQNMLEKQKLSEKLHKEQLDLQTRELNSVIDKLKSQQEAIEQQHSAQLQAY